ncbi:MAG TPA: ornithine cyclodeaminase family protein [Candidatus Limnocylindria bacterium]|nr:ornithine cyclodeaminase family protein [Candidatus Limnocylindria bacterium]
MSSALPFLSADAIVAAVPVGDMVDAVEAAFRDVVAGRDRSPLRTHVPLEHGDLLLMPGVRDGASGTSVKLVTVTPANTSRGLPTVQAVIAWFDATTGQPLALLDGPTVTAMRTGAASGAATRLMARPDAATLTVIGAGAQAEWQVRAVLAVRPIERVTVCSRSAGSRDALARRLADVSGVEVRAVADVEGAVRSADVVCCATTSATPVFDATWSRPGTHVNGIGAFRLGMVELPPELFGSAGTVAVDARQAALAEAGDLVAAIERGLVSEADLVEIGAVARDWVDTRDPDAITAFKSVGLAIQDVAAAEIIVTRLLG